MITENNITRLDRHLADLAMRDYLAANRKKDGKFRKRYVPYSLAPDTMEALEMYRLANKRENISHDEEVEVKDYLLKLKSYEHNKGGSAT